ncbi:MAG: branched-chain amino acid ABC transporter permease [Traorella sp.]
MKKVLCKQNLCWLILIVVGYVALIGLSSAGIIDIVLQTVLKTIMINIILAVSLNLIIGITGQFSLGHAGFMCVGAYCVGVMVQQLGGLTGFFVGILLGMVINTILALIVAIPTLRLKGDYLAIATLGFGEIIRIIVLNLNVTNGAAGMNLPRLVNFHILYAFLILSILLVVNFGRSAVGRACISIREDEIASEAMGINTTKYKVLAFVIGAIVASWAGALYAGSFYIIKPDMFTYNKSIDILVIVVFGGMGSVTGSVIAAITLGLINSFLQSFSSVRMIIYGIALVCIMIFRPSGLLGTKEFTFTELLNRFKKKEVKS